LMHLRGIGLTSAWVFVMEYFGWRQFHNRKAVAALAGLTPMPYASGDSFRDQGMSKAGDRRIRTLLSQIAWGWLRYQPHSALSVWFNTRLALRGKRMRRIGIVALARRWLIALWRYVQSGTMPESASLKPLSPDGETCWGTAHPSSRRSRVADHWRGRLPESGACVAWNEGSHGRHAAHRRRLPVDGSAREGAG
jgi:transposase